jgi:putative transposase
MPNYHHNYEGTSYFFTVVTFNRLPILTGEIARQLLHSAFSTVAQRYPFITDAICLLPDHIHCIWALPEEDKNYSVRWKEIKRRFTKGYMDQIGSDEIRNISREKRREASIWQRRFWEHTIRDQEDMNRHINYIHYNPMKHGLVKRVMDWQWSSFLTCTAPSAPYAGQYTGD